MSKILGISAFYHDSAAALLVDGKVVAAAQEERFSRRKHDDDFPRQAVRYCLETAGLEPKDLDFVGFYDKPLLTFDRLLESYLSHAPAGFASFLKAMPVWLKRKLHLPREMRQELPGFTRRFVFLEHHESHAASAFFPSPFEEAAILTLDGVGEWATATLGVGRSNRIEIDRELRFPHSLGLLYSAFTAYCGFKVNGGEYKLMGLAPYGEPTYTETILDHLIDLRQDGSFRLDMSYFEFSRGLKMFSPRFETLFGGPARDPAQNAAEPLDRRHMDLAASIQKVTEKIVLRQARFLHRETGLKDLCMAGGVALNCVANGRLLREGPFERLWVQPAAGDAGGAVGVAWFIWHQLLDQKRPAGEERQARSLLGPRFGDSEIEAFLRSTGAAYTSFDEEAQLIDAAVDALESGEVLGFFDGAMEYGPRALGSRSILGDARDPEMQARINQKVKFREGFRPFAPAVLKEHTNEFFELEPADESPYMLLVTPVREEKLLPSGVDQHEGLDRLKERRSVVPAITHVDNSARVQTVDALNGRYFRLLREFHQRTGSPVLVNTSFNLGWEPIVCTPEDAYRTFMACELDALCLGRFLIRKSQQPVPRGRNRQPSPETPLEIFADAVRSPCCRQPLEIRAGATPSCSECEQEFADEGGIPRLFWPHETFDSPADVTRQVRAFYEETPFPNYDEHDSVRSLIEKSRRGLYAKRLDESIPYNATVLEVGCGTGQLSNFLGIGHRRVLGADLCLNSLKLGEDFRQRFDLGRVGFIQMNLFRPALAADHFDVVLCNGVLHHTADPRAGFERLVELVKPGGFLVIGLYHRWGRWATDLRRQIFRVTGGRFRFLDPMLRRDASAAKDDAWFADQYRHPHESKHGFDEVLRWFDAANVEFIRGIPGFTPGEHGLDGESLFEHRPRGSRLERRVVEATQILTGQAEGGFFLVIGRKL